MEIRGHEIRRYVKIEELEELRRSLEDVRQARINEHVRTPSHEHERQPVPIYYGKGKDLSAFLNLFFNWAVSQNVEAALTSDVSVVMTTQKSQNELYDQYGRDIVDKSLTVWNALNKAVERDRSISTMVMRAKTPSDAWTLLKGMVESDDSDIACESAKKEFNNLKMIVGESAREYITRAKGLATTVRYQGTEVTERQLGNRILTGLPSHMRFVREGFALKLEFSVAELEHALIKAEELHEQPDASDGHAMAAVSKPCLLYTSDAADE